MRSLSTRHQSQLLNELRFAWDRAPHEAVQAWAADTAAQLWKVFVRRGKSLSLTLVHAGRLLVSEVAGGVEATVQNRFTDHAKERASAASASARQFYESTQSSVLALRTALKERPRETGPELVVGLLAFLVASGGPDADGGVPDLDLAVGIGAHRSIFTHSVLSGAILETALYSVCTLVGLVHAYLPEERDPLWDRVNSGKEQYLKAASAGISAGIAYHLLIDGAVQEAAYKDLPISMPMEGHQAIFIANAAAEAMDVFKKGATFDQKIQLMTSSKFTNLLAVRIHLAEHARVLQPIQLRPSLAKALRAHAPVIAQYGRWLRSLAEMKITPLTDAQERFVKVAQGGLAPKTPYEHAWLACVAFYARPTPTEAR